jgi:pimeloyl-ACP methyl ester carboxylesterase
MTLWPSYSFIHGNVLPFTSLRLEVPIEGEPSTMDSVTAHFKAQTLERGLPGLDLPALLIHGAGDPMPLSATTETAALIRGARVEVVDEAGYFPWLERPGEIRRIVAAFLEEHPAPSIPDRRLDPDFIPEP